MIRVIIKVSIPGHSRQKDPGLPAPLPPHSAGIAHLNRRALACIGRVSPTCFPNVPSEE